MSQPYVGEIRSVGFTFAPVGYFLCDGSLKSIAQYEVLYTLLGTTYGGDGVNTFGVPDLRGRMVVHQGTGPGRSTRVLGQNGGTEGVTLLQPNLPAHSHNVLASTAAGNVAPPTGSFLAAPIDTTTPTNTILRYLPDSFSPKTIIPLDPTTVVNTGGSLPHENRMPFLAISYIIAWAGIFPTQN